LPAISRSRTSATGQAADSPAIDRASGSPAARDISGSTRSDNAPDTGTADIGYHADATASTTPPAFSVPPSTSGPTVLHVDATAGDDARSILDALDASTPWKTIGRALGAGGAESGDTVVVGAGTYDEAVQTTQPGVTLTASGAVIVTRPAAARPS